MIDEYGVDVKQRDVGVVLDHVEEVLRALPIDGEVGLARLGDRGNCFPFWWHVVVGDRQRMRFKS